MPITRFLFEEAVNAVEMFIAIGFLTKYLGCKHTGKRAVGDLFIGWFAAFVTLSVMNYVTVFESIGTYLYILVYFIYALLFLKGKVLLKLWMSVLTQIIITIVAVTTIVSIACIMRCSPISVITDFSLPRILTLVFSKVFVLMIYRIILKQHSLNFIEDALWYKLIFIPFISVIAITMLMKVALAYPDTKFSIWVGMFALAAANIMVYYFYIVINKEYQNRLIIKLLEQQNENIHRQIEEADTFVKEMRSVRHDMKNQLLSIGCYLNEGQIKQAQSYITYLTDSYFPDIQKYIDTDNSTFDAIMNAKMTVCRKKNLYLEIRYQSGALLEFDPIDIGILFGNLLDNAIEASENSTGKHITVEVETKGEYLAVLVRNSIDTSVLSGNRDLRSTKSDKERHGIGLKSVKSLVKKYDGMIQFFEENKEFCCSVMIDKEHI